MRVWPAIILVALLLSACGSDSTRSTTSNSATTTPMPTSGPNIPATQTRGVELTQIVSLQATIGAPTATTTATATPAATATPPATATRPSPSATATPGKVEVVAQNVQSYRDSIGGLWFIGEVLNTGQNDAADIQVAISLLDATGQTLAVGSAGSFSQALPILKPGAKMVWRALIDKGPAEWKEQRIQVQSGPVSAFTRTAYVLDLRADGATVNPAAQFTNVTISGQVTNTGAVAAKNIHVTIGIYDATGKLLRVGDGYAKLEQIAPGASAPFSIDFTGVKELPAKYDIYLAALK